MSIAISRGGATKFSQGGQTHFVFSSDLMHNILAQVSIIFFIYFKFTPSRRILELKQIVILSEFTY